MYGIERCGSISLRKKCKIPVIRHCSTEIDKFQAVAVLDIRTVML